MKKHLNRRNLSLVIKWGVAIVALLFIFRQIQLKDRSHEVLDDLQLLVRSESIPFLILLLVGTAINWSLEAYKWEVLLRGKEDVSFWRSLKAVFSGVTIAVCTPNRVGEYAGRVFHLRQADLIDGVLLTIVGSLAQLLITVMAGLVALTFYLPRFVGLGPLDPIRYYITSVSTIIICSLLVLFYLNSHALTPYIERLPMSKKVKKYAKVLTLHDRNDLLRILLASLGRYVVFSSQFMLLLWLFGVKVPLLEGLMMVGLSYYVMTIIPTIAITELGIRGTVSLYFIGQLSDNVAGIVSASSVLWFINLVLPALLGVVFIFEMKFFRKED